MTNIHADKIQFDKSEATVLVVDDDPPIQKMVAHFIENEGFKVVSAMNGKTALDTINGKSGIDLIVLDVMMPDITGLDVCRAVREKFNFFELPILMLSALTESNDIVKGLQLGANDYITKPTKRVELLARVNNLVALKQIYLLAKANEQLASRRNLYDDLTGLPNRTYLNHRFQELIPEAIHSKSTIAVLFMNINRFKSINDSLGHGAGDIYLREIAKKLVNHIGKNGLVIRLYTDVFAIVRTYPGKFKIDQVRQFAQELLSLVKEPVVINQYDLELSASIGISLFPDDARIIDDLYRHADSAMHHAKGRGVNTCIFYSRKLSSSAVDRFNLEHKLKKGLEHGEFSLYYQPQMDLKKEQVVGAEALVRWNNPEQGMISPLKFIPVAEETGMIVPMGEWILKQACVQNMQWQKMGLPAIRIGVNLSPQQFHRTNLPQALERILKKTGMDPRFLDLEITESTIMSNMEEAVKILHKLREMGISISVDDFGTGYSSLNYLKRFPIHTLKIDQSFIRDLGFDLQNSAIVTSIIKLAHNLNLNVIAEGVETRDQLEYLKDNYCNEIQGYILSKPLSAEKLTELLVSNHQFLSNSENPE